MEIMAYIPTHIAYAEALATHIHIPPHFILEKYLRKAICSACTR